MIVNLNPQAVGYMSKQAIVKSRNEIRQHGELKKNNWGELWHRKDFLTFI